MNLYPESQASMPRFLQVLVCASTVSLLTSSVWAKEVETSATSYHGVGTNQTSLTPDRLQSALKASDLMGMTVQSYQNEKLGKVEDLAVDVESGRIVQVILASGGFLGLGEVLTAVPPGSLHADLTNRVLHLNSDPEKFKNAPRFEVSKWSESSTTNRLMEMYRYHGRSSDLRFIEQGDTSVAVRSNTDGSSTDRTVVTAWNKNSADLVRQTTIPKARLGELQSAKKLMGSTVQNLQNERIGSVEDVLVDIESGRLLAVVVSSGGFLGMGDDLSAVPPTALRRSSAAQVYQLDATKEQLTASPRFKRTEWPDFAQPAYSSTVYRAYRVEPYFTTDVTADVVEADRKQQNRTNDPLTPLDQGNGAADVDISARIRRGIMDGQDFSVSAQNVKIITNQGQVTLRGQVDSAEEKTRIGVIANDIAQVENVRNQLDVK